MWYCEEHENCVHQCLAKDGYCDSEISQTELVINKGGITCWCFEIGRNIKIVEEFILKVREALNDNNS